MANEIENKEEGTSSVIYVNFKTRKTKSSFADPLPEEIYALFAPRFGDVFTEWFIDQYKKLEA